MLLEKPVMGIAGDTNVGKSTSINALLGRPVSPFSPLHLTRVVGEIRASKEKSGNCFSVIFADGEETDIEIQSLWDTMEWDTMDGQQKAIERLILYAEPSMLLQKTRLVDLPGLKMDREATALEFLENETDVLVYVVESETDVRLFEVTDPALPGETVIVVNKIDKRIDWQDPALCLEKVAKSTEDRAREDIQKQADGNTEVVAVSALIALASEIWEDQIFESVLQIAKPGDLAIISKNTYFGEERAGLLSVQYRQTLLEQANSCFLGPWRSPAYAKPAFPALIFAIGLAIHQDLKSPKQLRDVMREFSGIDRLRSVLVSVSESARITARQEALDAEAEIVASAKSLGEIRLLLDGTDRMAMRVGGLGRTEEHRYFNELRNYLQAEEGKLALRLRERQQRLSSMRQAYQETASD